MKRATQQGGLRRLRRLLLVLPMLVSPLVVLSPGMAPGARGAELHAAPPIPDVVTPSVPPRAGVLQPSPELPSVLGPIPNHVQAVPPLSDLAVRQSIVGASLRRMSARGVQCPCPFSVTRKGHQCGEGSLYSRHSANSPICFPQDVSDTMVTDWRQHNNAAQ